MPSPGGGVCPGAASGAVQASSTTLSFSSGKGATMIGGVMSDRATDRHARVVLRQATALGRFDAGRAFALGVIDAAELAEVSGA